MKYLEKPLTFQCAGETLMGILTQPRHGALIGVVVVVGGPQYRAGSHRQFVLLGRTLAAAGYPVLRFDHRGMGDSGGGFRNFEQVGPDIDAAIAALRAACPDITRVVLWGLCDGASAALLYWHETRNPCVDGLVLVNPWVRSQASLARTQVKHYYARRLLQGEFWHKCLRGDWAMADSLRHLWRSLRLFVTKSSGMPGEAMSFQTRMALAWQDFSASLLLVLSGQDYVAREFIEYTESTPAWSGLLDRPNVQRLDLPEADHTFSREVLQHELEQAVLEWLRRQEWQAQRLAS